MNISFTLEKELVEKLVNYLGSKPWLEVQHLVAPLIAAIQTDIKAIEAEVEKKI